MENQTIDGQILFARNAITNARDVPAISTEMAEYGYDTPKLEEGLTLVETTQSRHTTQKREYGEQYGATDAFQTAREAADKIYMRHLKLARIALKDHKALYEALQLTGMRKQSFPGWLQQAKAFYTNALLSPVALEELAKLNVTQEALTAASEALLDVEKKHNVQLKEKGEAQAATIARDEALDALNEWMSRFIAVARVALEDNPQMLEALGIVKR